LFTWKPQHWSFYQNQFIHLVFDQEVTRRVSVVLENKKKKP